MPNIPESVRKVRLDSQVYPRKITFHCNITNDYEMKVREEMLDSGENSDIEILVGSGENPKSYRANSFILKTGSKKFREILDKNKGKKFIELPHVSSDEFETLLKVIYINRFDIVSIQAASNLAKLFTEFGLDSAANKCHEYLNIKENITPETCVSIYETSDENPDNKEVSKECLYIFRTLTKDVLVSEGFHRAKPETVLKIFELPELSIRSDLELLVALESYALVNNALPGHNLEGNHEKFLTHIRPALCLIRFLTINPYEFVVCHSAKRLLTTEEILGILANILVLQNSQIPYPKEFSTNIIHRAMLSQQESNHSLDTSGICSKSINYSMREATVLWNVTDLARKLNPTPNGSQIIELDQSVPNGNSTLTNGGEVVLTDSWRETPLTSKSNSTLKDGGSNAPIKRLSNGNHNNKESPKGNSFKNGHANENGNGVNVSNVRPISVDEELWE